MATASATLSSAKLTTAAIASSTRSSSHKRTRNVVQIAGLNAFVGLKAHNSVTSLGLPVATEQAFVNFVNTVKATSTAKGRRGGGALSSTCNAAGEIFNIVTIMSGLVLVGVAVGFVLLRIEAFVEESE